MTSGHRQRKKHFVWSVVVVFLIQLPLLLYNTTSLSGAVVQIAIFLVAAVVVGFLYVGLVNHLHADRQEPIPWYASPVVWLGLPLLVVFIYIIGL